MYLTYNGVNLALTSIDRVNRDTILSDDGTTVVCVETTLSVSGVYYPPIGGVPNIGGTSVAGFRRNKARTTLQRSRVRQNVRGQDPGGFYGISAALAATSQTTVAPRVPAPGGVPGSATAGIGFGSKPSGGGTLQPTFGTGASQNGGVLQPQFVEGVAQFTFAPPIPLTSGANPNSPSSCALPSVDWAGPMDTDRELELRLRAPRKKLIVWAYDKTGLPLVWIESPRRNAPSDARTGPVVLNSSVKAAPNGNSFFVALDIRTWLSPAEDGSDRPILSHRWQMTHTEDEDHYLSREIKGEVVFDLGNIREARISPDVFRKQLFHPIPLGFKRNLGPVALSPDGSTLIYSYSDTDQKIVFDAASSGATRMTIQEYVQYTNPWRGFS